MEQTAEVSPIYFISICTYLAVLIGFGVYLSRQVKTQEDFAVAGRSLPTFVIFGTLVATWTGTGSLFGGSEKAYNAGLPILLVISSELIGFGFLYFLAGKVRKMAQITIQDLLELRYNATARVFGALAVIIAYTTIVSYQFRAAGLVLNLAMPAISPEMGAVIAALVIIGFAMTAGLLSVAYTDLILGVTMIVGLFFGAIILVGKAGGVGAVLSALPEGHLNPFNGLTFLGAIGIFLPTLLLLLGDANLYQRFFAAKSAGVARKGVWFTILGVAAVEMSIVSGALASRVLVPDLEDPGRVLAYAAFNFMPMVLGVIMLTAMTAVIVSTADSYLLAPATSMTRDIYQRFFRKDASTREVLLVSRLMVVGLGVIAFGLSKLSDEFLGVMLYAFTIYGASVTPSLVAALVWKRATTPGAIASIVSGTVVTLLWKALGFDASTGVDAVIPAALISTSLLIGISFATPKPAKEKLEPFGLA